MVVTSAVAQFIENHGGAVKLAGVLGRPPLHVRMWKHRNRIPRAAWPDIIQAVPDVTLDELMEVEALSEPFLKRRA